MDPAQRLKETISRYWNLPAEQIDWDMEFNDRRLAAFSSLRMLRFLASVEEQFQINIQDSDAVKRFKDLWILVEGRCSGS
ncbi:MAG: acyl carrier protein [Candidatus Omnitrophica bacterium]|nr:acyl carrier protein [Candidatus Omnitrophota bacterium]